MSSTQPLGFRSPSRSNVCRSSLPTRREKLVIRICATPSDRTSPRTACTRISSRCSVTSNGARPSRAMVMFALELLRVECTVVVVLVVHPIPGFPERLERLVELGRAGSGRRRLLRGLDQVGAREVGFDRRLGPADGIVMADDVPEHERCYDQR